MSSPIPDSRCGLRCSSCGWKESHGCGGCIETQGHPFHGACHIAQCCQDKGHAHCGECAEIPCDKLFAYSYLDAEHGDKPQGERMAVCRGWAAAQGKARWQNVLLTSAGWVRSDDSVKSNIMGRFQEMLPCPPEKARVLFIPVAAIDEEALRMAEKCRQELLAAGIVPEHIVTYMLDGALTLKDAMGYDVVYCTGGDTQHLRSRVMETGFDQVIKAMVYANKVYVGISAGSILATPNIGDPYDADSRGLALLNAYLSVHCDVGAASEAPPLTRLSLTDEQAAAVSWEGYTLIEG